MPMHPTPLDTKTRNNLIFLSIRAMKAGHSMTLNRRFGFSCALAGLSRALSMSPEALWNQLVIHGLSC
jgi:hypothetical protein